MLLILLLILLGFQLGCLPSGNATGPSPELSGHPASPDGHGHEEGHEAGTHGEGDEHEEADEGFVTLTEEQKKEIALKVAPIGTGRGNQTGLRTGRVEADPDRRVIVSSQVSGTVLHLPVTVGSQIRRGDLIATLQSPEVAQLKAEYHGAEVEADLAAKELTNIRGLLAVGDESRRDVEEAKLELARAQASRDGIEARLKSSRLAFDRLAQLEQEGIASKQQVEEATAEQKALEADLRQAKTEVEIANQHLERERRVSGSAYREKAETFPAEANLARAKESIKHLEERLKQLGANPEANEGNIDLISPINGQVVERPVTRGEIVHPDDSVATLVDSSQVWVFVDLLRSDLASVKVGDRVDLRLTTDKSVAAQGVLSYIETQVKPNSQTVRGRVTLREGVGKFRVGSFVDAVLKTEKETEVTLVPTAALQQVEGRTVVYLVEGEGFQRTTVSVTGTKADASIVEGLPKEAQVVVQGASDLKALDLAGTIGGHHH